MKFRNFQDTPEEYQICIKEKLDEMDRLFFFPTSSTQAAFILNVATIFLFRSIELLEDEDEGVNIAVDMLKEMRKIKKESMSSNTQESQSTN